MKATIGLEYIGCNTKDQLRQLCGMFNGLSRGLGDTVIGGGSGGPWVAEILGRHPRFKLDRKFVESKRDYTNANSKGSRGVYLWFVLEAGKLYEVNDRLSWQRSDRYFCSVSFTGEIRRLTATEVEAWLNNH